MRLVGTTNTVYTQVSECAQITAGRGLRAVPPGVGETRHGLSIHPGPPRAPETPVEALTPVHDLASSGSCTMTIGRADQRARRVAMPRDTVPRIVEHASTRYRRFVATSNGYFACK